MIVYHKSGIHHVLNIFRLDGSVFPRVLVPSLICAAIAGGLRHILEMGYVSSWPGAEDDKFIMMDTTMWQGFSWVVGFLIVFRTSMAYNRFWEGCTQLYRMRAEWMDACSSIFAFLKYPGPAQEHAVTQFQHLLVRLFSMLHALALAEIEDSSSKMPEDVFAYGLPLIDPNAIDQEALATIRRSDQKVELVFQWIQQLMVENLHIPNSKVGVLSIPPPIMSRAFQELSNGMVCFQEAIKVTSIPFPFPYAQTCDCLLMVHWLVTPLVVCQWFPSPIFAALFTFIVVFVLWVLNCIAVEIENPFGPDPNDIDCSTLHEQMNAFLMQLLSPEQHRLPTLQMEMGLPLLCSRSKDKTSFFGVWTKTEPDSSLMSSAECEVMRSCRRPSMCSGNTFLRRADTRDFSNPRRGSTSSNASVASKLTFRRGESQRFSFRRGHSHSGNLSDSVLQPVLQQQVIHTSECSSNSGAHASEQSKPREELGPYMRRPEHLQARMMPMPSTEEDLPCYGLSEDRSVDFGGQSSLRSHGNGSNGTEIHGEDAAEASGPTVGDTVRILRDGGGDRIGTVGKTGRIRAADRSDHPFKVLLDDGREFGYHADDIDICQAANDMANIAEVLGCSDAPRSKLKPKLILV